MLVLAATFVSCGLASAQSGVNLSWSDCGDFGTALRTFACNTNSGSSTMVLSVYSGAGIPELVGGGSVIFLQTDQPTLSNWWRFDSGGCRASALTAGFDFSGQFNCADPWGGAVSGSLVYEPQYYSTNSARIVTAGQAVTPGPMNATDEYYLHKLTIDYSGSTGTGACGGCTDAVCIFVSYARLVRTVGLPDLVISNPAVRNYVLWQNGLGGNCPPSTPPPVSARTPTWGAVKSLYR